MDCTKFEYKIIKSEETLFQKDSFTNELQLNRYKRMSAIK